LPPDINTAYIKPSILLAAAMQCRLPYLRTPCGV
jgi:hypothetical protein